MLESLVDQLKRASRVILSTHRHCDGDGLGAELALYAGLRQLGKQVWIIHPDAPPKKYGFLDLTLIQVAGEVPSADLAVILDTNDRRLVEPLYSELVHRSERVVFVDHHPALQKGPTAPSGSVIDVNAASTGEIVWRILRALGVQMNDDIARALYTSVVFDTQLFRYMKSDPSSHQMAADLLRYEREPEAIHRALFATYTVEKMNWLAGILTRVEYLADKRVAFISVNSQDARASGIEADECADVIDLVMNIESVEVAALLREDAPGEFKLSLRSKGGVQVLPLAETFGGGGHPFASGAYLRGHGLDLRERLVARMIELVGQAR